MIKKFSTLYIGHIELETAGTPEHPPTTAVTRTSG